MKNNPLNIVSVDTATLSPPKKTSARDLAQSKFDRLWLQNPEQFDPTRNCMEKERLQRSLALIESQGALNGKIAVDLGSGKGDFSRLLRDKGAQVTAVDISANAIKAFEAAGNTENISIQRDYVPKTLLDDSSFDVVIALDLIAYLDPSEYRLFFAEVARLVNSKGSVVCSTPVDTHSTNALQQFADLAATELQIEKWIFSHHALYLSIKDFFLAPSRFLRASKNKEYRKEALAKRFFLNHYWFALNSTFPLSFFWKTVNFLFKPILNLLDHNRTLLLFLEKKSSFFFYNGGISHALFIATRKPLMPTADLLQQPIERKQKRQIWE